MYAITEPKIFPVNNLSCINFFSNSLPSVFSGYFETLVSNHNRNTRNGNNLIKIQDHSTNFAAASIKIQGAKVWNKLDNKLKAIPKIKGFRKKFKSSCFSYERSPAS